MEFQLFADNAPLGPPEVNGPNQDQHGQEDTAVAGKTCTTNALGNCTISDVVPGRYWVVETAGLPDYTLALTSTRTSAWVRRSAS